jgi:hypothetical protein
MEKKKKKRRHLHAAGAQRREFLLHTVSDTREHGRSTREDNVSIEVTTNIQVTLEYRVVAGERKSDDGSTSINLVLTSSRGYRLLQDPRKQAGKEPREHGT